jgi:hypothetical protein
MPWYVAHFDETDHMDGRLLGFGGSFTTGGRLPGLAETWEEMREDLEMAGREIRWNWNTSAGTNACASPSGSP